MLSRIVASHTNEKQLLRECLRLSQKSTIEWSVISSTVKSCIRELKSLEDSQLNRSLQALQSSITSKNKKELQLAISDCLFSLAHL